MPIAHSLSKVSKRVSKATGSIHVKGRNFKKLNKATLRHNKLQERKANHLQQKQNDLQIVKYLQQEVNQEPEQDTYTLGETKAYIENFLTRFDEEIEELRSERRPGRPPTARQTILEEKKKYDEDIYKTGLRIPNLADKTTVELLRKWNGTTGGTTIFKFIRVAKDMDQLPIQDEEMN